MMKTILFALLTVFLAQCAIAQRLEYPVARKSPVTDTFFDRYKVTDDYRWMENSRSDELKAWLDTESTITHRFLQKKTDWDAALAGIKRYADARFQYPVKDGKYYFHSAYVDGISDPVLFVQNSLTSESVEIFDPNFISHSDRITIRYYKVSQDSRYLAYEYSRNGSDWVEIGITEIDGGTLKDHLTNVRYSSIAWHGDGFFYSAYPRLAPLARAADQTIYYHRLGTSQSQDKVIFKRRGDEYFFAFRTTPDGRYFILNEENQRTGRESYFYIDYSDANPALKPLLANLNYHLGIAGSHNGMLIVANGYHSDMGSIIGIDPLHPFQWKAIVPQYKQAVLMKVIPLKDKIVALYRSKVTSFMVTTDYNGRTLNTISFPAGYTVEGLRGAGADTELFYTLQSYTTPPVGYLFNTATYENKVVKWATVNYDYQVFQDKEVDYKINDSVSVPMLLVYKKGLKLNGENPVLLEAYGGYGAINEPEFDPGIVYFLENGGVFAYACVRGGGELGTKWALAGERLNIQHAVTDVIEAARYLEKAGYTSPAKLAVSGASNGGMVIAAAVMQHPELFEAAIPVVAPFDMIRFENFTIGSLNNGEFGTVKDSLDFVNLYHLSPYNNIRNDVNYPAMLIVTSDHDDRVVPLHSYKFAAAMQSRPAQTNPVLLLVNRNSGHYGRAGNSLLDDIRSKADFYGFLLGILK